jgi:hypothetical protein
MALCRECNEPCGYNSTLCDWHASEHASRVKANGDSKKAVGGCKTCGKTRSKRSMSFCDEHLEKRNKSDTLKRKRKKANDASGVCGSAEGEC